MENFFYNPWVVTIFGGIFSSVVGGLLVLLIKGNVVLDRVELPDFWPGFFRFLFFIVANIVFNIVLYFGGVFFIIEFIENVIWTLTYPREVSSVPSILYIVIHILGSIIFALWSFFRIVLGRNLFERY
jgi:hypothetical protein